MDQRQSHCGCVLLLLAVATACDPPPPDDKVPPDDEPVVVLPDPTRFIAGPVMAVARVGHTATALPDGRVLVVGGETGVNDANRPREPIDSVEITDAAASLFVALAGLPEPRSNHAAVVLNDGRVLIVGGGQSTFGGQPAGERALASALLFDPADDSMTATGSMATARSHFGAVKLDDGRVLVAGGGAGTHDNAINGLADALASVEIYDPATGAFSPGPPLTHPRFSFSLSQAGGQVFAIGGVSETEVGLRSVEVLAPATSAWTAGADLVGPAREHHSAIVLKDGTVLVVGGKDPNITPLDLVDRYLPATDAWQAVGTLTGQRTGTTLALLPSGAALIIGGFEQRGPGTVATVERCDGTALTAFAPLDEPRLGPSAALRPDGTVLVCGGTLATGTASATCTLAVP